MDEQQNPIERPAYWKAVLLGLCPRCHARNLFMSHHMLQPSFAHRCDSCGLDYTSFNVGDGPAALLIIPIGAVIIAMALWLHHAVILPVWIHAAIWVPVTTLLTLISIRAAKAALLIAEYRRNAGEAGGSDLQ